MINLITINIIYTRTKNKFSQKEFASIFNITQTTLSNYERGKNEPTLDFVMLYIFSL